VFGDRGPLAFAEPALGFTCSTLPSASRADDIETGYSLSIADRPETCSVFNFPATRPLST
jgi:hypothetical protein